MELPKEISDDWTVFIHLFVDELIFISSSFSLL